MGIPDVLLQLLMPQSSGQQTSRQSSLELQLEVRFFVLAKHLFGSGSCTFIGHLQNMHHTVMKDKANLRSSNLRYSISLR